MTTVTCVITAHNHERFVGAAVDSALGQDYPPDLLDVVVVNDGSSDSTRMLLDAQFARNPRVTLIHQDNRGFVAAMNRALAAATGELIGILDGDDTWPADRLRRQVAMLEARPELGLVHGDMEIVDADGAILNPSFFAFSRYTVPRGRILGTLLSQNVVAGGATLVRAVLRERFLPIPEELVYPDWHIAARVAEVAAIDHVDGSVNSYRLHASNMGLGGTGRRFFSDMRNNVRIQRWMLRHLDTASASTPDLLRACDSMLSNAAHAAAELDTWAVDVLPTTASDRDEAAEQAALARRALLEGRPDDALRGLVRALAADPWDGSARADLAVAHARTLRADDDRQPPPDTRRAAVLAFADELVGEPGLLVAYLDAVDADDDVTLLVHTRPPDAARDGAALATLAADALDRPGAADVLLYPCGSYDDLLTAPIRAVYTRRMKPSAFASVPRLDDASLPRLSDLLGVASV